jgi:Na+/proline symporter
MCFGAVGGALLTRRGNTRAYGFEWAAGMLGGCVASAVAFFITEVLLEDSDYYPNFNVFVFLFGVLPGMVVYSVVKRCSDYTFPEYIPIPDAYQSIPHAEISRPQHTSSARQKHTSNSSSISTTSNTHLLV